MKLRPRLWLFGAVLPALGLTATIVVAGEIFRLSLVDNLDDALRAQASVERVSLFDGPDGEPHLIHRGEAIEEVSEHPSIVAVYDASGNALIQFPHAAHSPRRLDWLSSAIEDGLSFATLEGVRFRELRTVVRSPNGREYLMRLASPLEPIERTVATFYKTTASVGVVVALLLLLVQAWQAHSLVRRLRAMTDYLPKLRDGVLALESLPEDKSRDEIAEQRDALAEAAVRVQRARDAQERLIANAAHELRTPLTIMRTRMDLALRRERSAPELRAALDESRDEVDRLALLASRLLDLASVSKVARDLRSGDLVELLGEAVAAYRGEAEAAGLTMELRTPPQATATFEHASLRQAVDNLLSNACKHAPRGSAVHVSLQRIGAHWEIAIADEGPGVRDDQRDKVFEPFYRGTQKAGAGLGLAIVREIARAHGGDSTVAHARFGITIRA